MLNRFIKWSSVNLLLTVTLLAAAPDISLRGWTSSSLTVAITTTPGTVPDTCYFAVPVDPLSGVVISGKMADEAAVELKRHAAGRVGTTEIGWYSFTIEKNTPSRDVQILVDCHYATAMFAGLKREGFVCGQGMVLLRKTPRTLAKTRTVPSPPVALRTGLKMMIENDGVYALSRDVLRTAGVPVGTIDPRTFRLLVRDGEVPLLVTNSHHKRLEEGDRLLFYGKKLCRADNRPEAFSEANCYWLTWGGTFGSRVAVVSGARRNDPTVYSSARSVEAAPFTDTVHIEFDETMLWLGNLADRPPVEVTDAPGADSDVDNWYWGPVGISELSNFTFDLLSPEPRTTARLRLGIMGQSSSDSIQDDHQLTVFINNNPASQKNLVRWDGQRYKVFESDTFSSDLLKDGENRLTLQTASGKGSDRSMLDWIELVYQRGYTAGNDEMTFSSGGRAAGRLTEYTLDGFTGKDIEVWDISNHRAFSGGITRAGSGKNRGTTSYIFQDSLGLPVMYYACRQTKYQMPLLTVLDTVRVDWDSAAACDYLVITAESLATELEPLCALHRLRGLKTAIVSIDDVYNAFTFGIRDPQAVSLLLRKLQLTGEGRVPRFLLLAGDATHDLDKKNRERTIVPVNLARIPGWGPASDDGCYSLVNSTDQFPDCAVGRFPAQNRAEMRAMVRKTIDYISKPDYGYWRDNLLLLGGGEAEFTGFNNRARSELIGSRMHIKRMDADPASPFYKDGFIAAGRIADELNAGCFIVNFNGHGGGNIWSDNDFFGFDDLRLLHNGQWRGGRLPVVFSFTCLTGFFESSDYRSLGEEFLKVDKEGAIAFYGASAYTSRNGNMIMNRLFLEEALSGRHATIGELVSYCEMAMLVRFQSQYIHLVRQYNLLGDPALPLALTPDTLGFNHTLAAGGTQLAVKGAGVSVKDAQVRIALDADYVTLDQAIVAAPDRAFHHTFSLKPGMASALGTLRAYAWNDSGAVCGYQPFAKDTLDVAEVKSDPEQAFFNDSILVTCRIAQHPDSTAPEVYCMYAVTHDDLPQGDFSGIPMVLNEGGIWKTSRKLFCPFSGEVNDRLVVFFRVIGKERSVQSKLFSLPLNGLPDCVIAHGLQVIWQDDSLRLPFTVQNIGNAAAPLFTVAAGWNEGGQIAEATTSTALPPGASVNFTIALPDTSGNVMVRLQIDPQGKMSEVVRTNNSAVVSSRIFLKDVRENTDTLRLDSLHTVMPAATFSSVKRLVVIEDTILQAAPLATTSEWRSRRDGHPVKWLLAARPALDGEDSVRWACTGAKPAKNDTARARICFLEFDSLARQWRYSIGSSSGAALATMRSSDARRSFATAAVSDRKAPEIMVSVYGKTLEAIDYTAKNRPFSLFLSDPSMIIPASVTIRVNTKPVDASLLSKVPESGDLRTMTLAAYPEAEKKIDSLTVSCMDFAGNLAKRTFAYLPGRDLAIRSFSCHPNPFTAHKSGDGSIAKIRFAFLLTDVAKKVTLTIYTVSGKKVKHWTVHELIGYQQIEWDGRDTDGYRIANGTYYAKLVVNNDRRSDKEILRIAKLEGF